VEVSQKALDELVARLAELERELVALRGELSWFRSILNSVGAQIARATDVAVSPARPRLRTRSGR
jgi:hypothetical protein